MLIIKAHAIFLLTYEHLKKLLQGQGARLITKAEAVATFKYVQEYMQTNFWQNRYCIG